MSHPSLSPTPLFPLGRIVITPGVETILTPSEISRALHRHQHGDYGALEPDDVHQNNRGLTNCGVIMSVYHASDGSEYWIKTHGTRIQTTIMLPGE